jgi:hypothetical protein
MANIKYVSLISVDVERSFHIYKHIISVKIYITPERIEKQMIMNYFYKKLTL